MNEPIFYINKENLINWKDNLKFQKQSDFEKQIIQAIHNVMQQMHHQALKERFFYYGGFKIK